MKAENQITHFKNDSQKFEDDDSKYPKNNFIV